MHALWEHRILWHFPVLLLLGLFENTKENLKNTKHFSHSENPQKSCKTSREHSTRPRKFSGRKRPRKQKHQGKEGDGHSRRLGGTSGHPLEYEGWEPTDLGSCPKRENLEEWLGEGATSLLDPPSKKALALV